MPDAPILVAEKLTRRYGARVALEDFDLTLARGSLTGLLGVNGAGKSTVLKLLAGVLAPSSGRVRIDGRDLIEEPRAARALVGYAPESPPLYPELTVAEHLKFCARLRGLAAPAARTACARAIERLELGSVEHRLIAQLSRGFQQRVNLAQAQLHAPPLLLLDEPTAGLDPVQSHAVMEYIRALSNDHAVILSTHQLAEVRGHCAHVVMLHAGRIGWAGAVAELAAPRAVRVRLGTPGGDWSGLEGLVKSESADGLDWTLHADAPEALLARVAPYAASHALPLLELTLARDTLEQRFLALALGTDRARAA